MDFWLRYKRNRAAVVGLVIVCAIAVAALVGPYLVPHGPFELSRRPFVPPGDSLSPLGTDALGRDTLSQMLHGARMSLMIGLLAASVSVVIGVLVGALAGYTGRWFDALLMRVTELFQVMPRFILALVVVALLGGGITQIVLVLGALSWPPAARLVRAQFLALKEQEFVESARSIGVKPTQVIFREILPNALPPVIVIGSLDVAQAILLEAGLSFLGLGDPSVMSWGVMLNQAQRFFHQAWWLSVFPGLGIFVVVLAFNLIGDGLQQALNPQLRE